MAKQDADSSDKKSSDKQDKKEKSVKKKNEKVQDEEKKSDEIEQVEKEQDEEENVEQEDNEIDKVDKEIEHEAKKQKMIDKEPKRADFMQRFMAFILDIIIVTMVVDIISMPFVDSKNTEKLMNESNEVVQKYVDGEINIDTYVTEMIPIIYRTEKNNGFISLITIVMEILYFVVFQIYNDGQTIGKKLLKIKVVSKDGKLTMNQMIFRSLIINSILVELISFGFMLFASQKTYFYGVGSFEIIQYIILLISAFMVIFGESKEGLHDKIAHTKVLKL